MLAETIPPPVKADWSRHDGLPWLPQHVLAGQGFADQLDFLASPRHHSPSIVATSRSLNDKNDHQSYLVDYSGNSYEPYSLAWRYLGMYIDCDDEDNDDSNNDEHRQLGASKDNDDSGCARKVLWAAYHDPNYSGGSIGEYQYYDASKGIYDDSYCRADRCVPLDCHESVSENFELVGVFKETDGLYDFAEQLFKHQGYCLWDQTVYEKMYNYLDYIPMQCQELNFADSSNGNTLYMDLAPQPGGDMTLGVYTDDKCTKLSRTTTIQDYITMFYEYKGDYEKGQQIANAWTKNIKRWNRYMNVYKTCQPCRAYDLSAGGYNNNKGSADNKQRKRHLGDNDGEGDDEQWGYDCYDAAGYTNCNQCYKFETKTSMTAATIADLKVATQQGTILAIVVNGTRYGSGGVVRGWFWTIPRWAQFVFPMFGWMLITTMFVLLWRYAAKSALFGSFLAWIRNMWVRKRLPSAFKEHFHIESEVKPVVEELDEYGRGKKPMSYVYA